MNDLWRGWPGERRWSSLKGDLTLVARHDGHVRLHVTLLDSINWTVMTELTLAPGEELAGATQGLADLLT